jgi:hydroxymethylglutaryl-CoA lyase
MVDAAVTVGVDAVTLATTMGMAHPMQVDGTLAAIFDRHPDADLGLHLHDTNGMNLANALVGLHHDIARFDTAACGLGGVVLPRRARRRRQHVE